MTTATQTDDLTDEYVVPDPALDGDFYNLAQQYLEHLEVWRARFEDIRNRYTAMHVQKIIEALRAQGARTGRA